MAQVSGISWTDSTFNPWIGCARVSPACDGCYADALMGAEGRHKRAQWGGPGQGVGTRSRTAPSTWKEPRKWDRAKAAEWAEYNRLVTACSSEDPRPDRPPPAPHYVFCASLADVFDNAVPVEWRVDLFRLIAETPNLTWLLLTKRPSMIVRLFEETAALADHWPWPRNAAIGCTIISQDEANRDLPHLLEAKRVLKPAFAFVSMEPLLGPVDLTRVTTLRYPGAENLNALSGVLTGMFGDHCPTTVPPLDWIITGGETDQGGHKARPQNPEWFRDLRDQASVFGVAFHHKQNGEWVSVSEVEGQPGCETFTFPDERSVRRVGKLRSGRTIDGVTYDARPT